jgi:hypothetical protein
MASSVEETPAMSSYDYRPTDMGALAVFAGSANIHLDLCKMANFQPGSYQLYDKGDDRGQFGWDAAVNYTSLQNLVTQLPDVVRPGQYIKRLALSDHGAPGEFELVGAKPPLTVDSIEHYRYQLLSIRGFLTLNATVLLMGCNCAYSQAGSDFLKKLSEVFSGKKVVGFTTVGVEGHQRRLAEKCDNPGMRQTDYRWPAKDAKEEDERYWKDNKYLSLPWASENNKHAKIALNGKIKDDPDDLSQLNAATRIIAKWDVEVGSWTGVFNFTSNNEASWKDGTSPSWHKGKWWEDDRTVQFKFFDDVKTIGYQRTWVIDKPVQFVNNGRILPAGRGFFKMYSR